MYLDFGSGSWLSNRMFPDMFWAKSFSVYYTTCCFRFVFMNSHATSTVGVVRSCRSDRTEWLRVSPAKPENLLNVETTGVMIRPLPATHQSQSQLRYRERDP